MWSSAKACNTLVVGTCGPAAKPSKSPRRYSDSLSVGVCSCRRIRRQEQTPTERLSLYRLGDFEGFAAGPHVPTTKVLQAFALDHISGTLQQRIYGTCWSSQQELDTW